jgi:sarcosine oxidase subunit beta
MNTALTHATEQAGYLFLAGSNEELKNLTLANSLQQKTGVKDAILVTCDDIEKLNPHINMQNIIGGSFCPSDGFISPMNILNGYVTSSQNNGVKYVYNERVTKINCSGKKIESIEASSGKFSADLYVNAAGAWAGWLRVWLFEYLP